MSLHYYNCQIVRIEAMGALSQVAPEEFIYTMQHCRCDSAAAAAAEEWLRGEVERQKISAWDWFHVEIFVSVEGKGLYRCPFSGGFWACSKPKKQGT